MKRKKALIAVCIILSAVIIALCANVYIMRKFIKTYTYTEIEYRGYASKDVAEVKIDHSYANRILGFNEWRISVEFKEVPGVFFWFTYKDKNILFQGVSSEPMMDADSVIEYCERYKQGKLLTDTEDFIDVSTGNGSYACNVAFANWTDDSSIYVRALNHETMTVGPVQHLPVYKFDTKAELDSFKSSFSGILTMDQGHDEIPSFDFITASYDDSFFSKDSLMLVYVPAASSSYRFGVSSVYRDERSLCIYIEELNHPEVYDCMMAGWFAVVEIGKADIAGCTDFDAQLGKQTEQEDQVL